jgi:hypothetical protein
MTLLRKAWDRFLGWMTAMDYSFVDYTDDRIRALEREIERLRGECRPAGAAAAQRDVEPGAPVRDT